MSDYIKREDAKKWLTNLREDCGRYQDLWPYAEALDQIIELLSVDVAPVRRGRWIDDERYVDGYYANCSECGWQLDVKEERGYHNYCPNCGARMDGDGNEID